MRITNQGLWEKIKDRYFMDLDHKSMLVENNLNRILVLCPILAVFGFFMLINTKKNVPITDPNYSYQRLYYSIFFHLSFFAGILAIILKLIKVKVHPIIKNMPLYITFICFMLMSLTVLYLGPKPFNATVIFFCVVTITPLIFVIEPLFYNIYLFTIYGLMVKKIIEIYGISGFLNISIFLFILIFLSFQRWSSLIKQHKHDVMVKEHENKLQQELEMASIVQKNFYTHDLSDIKEWEVVYYNEPMASLSGDLFDFFNRQNNLSGLSIFDVSGHGLSAGLVTMLVKNTMEEEFYENEEYELEFTMQCINERVRKEKGNIENYLTGILLRFSHGKIEMVNAGHPLPVIYNAKENSSDFLKCDISKVQGAIGLGDLDFDFQTVEIEADTDDRIILYTDGITEAKNKAMEEWGKERFLASVQASSKLTVQLQMEQIIKDVKTFIGDAPKTDDISIIILRKKS